MRKIKLKKGVKPTGTFSSPNIIERFRAIHPAILSVVNEGIGIDYNYATKELSVFINNPIVHTYNQKNPSLSWTTRHQRVVSLKEKHLKEGVWKLIRNLEKDGYVVTL